MPSRVQARARYSRRQRWLAALVCLIALYFGGGGLYMHQHAAGHSESPCHVCQTGHTVVLSPTAATLLAAPQVVARHAVDFESSPTQDLFAHEHAGRAPPTSQS